MDNQYQKQSLFQRWLPTIVGVAIVLVAGGAILAYQNFWRTNPNPNPAVYTPTETSTPITNSTPTLTPDQAADWKNYTNNQYGFSIQYPQDWRSEGQAVPPSNTDQYGNVSYPKYSDLKSEGIEPLYKVLFFPANSQNGIVISINNNSKNYPLNQYFEIMNRLIPTGFPTSGKEVSVGEISGIKVSVGCCSNPLIPIVYFEKNNKIYSISSGGKYEEILNQMLSTFKFSGTENASGIIKSVYSKNGKNYLDIDYVIINPNWKPGGVSTPAYTNDNSKIRTFEISKNAKILVGSGTFSQISYQDFYNLFVTTGTVNGVATYHYQASNPWDIEVVDGVVTEITEHYFP